MRFSLFYELQLPRPWSEDSEQRLLDEALEQIELADRLGFHGVWAVEHHFLEEYAHSSASAVWLAAAASRTERLRIGLGIMPLPPGYQHPARVAEAAATLDLVSHGRVELGTGETSSEMELGGFGVDRHRKRAQWEEALGVVARMMVEEPFAGHRGESLEIPVRNVIPKPRQKPHPPLWVACSQRETIRLAAEKGIGALSFSFTAPDEAAAWVREYRSIIASDRCVPAGFAVNPSFAIATPMMVHRDERKARERGLDGARFFGYALAHYYAFGDHRPGETDVAGEFAGRGSDLSAGSDLEIARGAIGTPAQVADLVRGYEEAGVDELLLAVQVGANRHDHILESLELFAAEVMPEFQARRPRLEADKERELAEPIERALARRPPVDDHVGSRGAGDRPAAAVAARAAEVTARGAAIRRRVEKRAADAARAFVRSSSDGRLERLAGSDIVIRAMFRQLEKRYVPERANGFAGEIQYELERSEGSAAVWTLALDADGARARRGPADRPVLRLNASVADFVRIAGGELAPAKAVLTGRLKLHGDLMVAARLGEMFGQSSPF